MRSILLGLLLLSTPAFAQEEQLLTWWQTNEPVSFPMLRTTSITNQTYISLSPGGTSAEVAIWHPGVQRIYRLVDNVDVFPFAPKVRNYVYDSANILIDTFDLDDPHDELGQSFQVRLMRRFGDFILHTSESGVPLSRGNDCGYGRVAGYNRVDPTGTHQIRDLNPGEIPMEVRKVHGFFWIFCRFGTLYYYSGASGLNRVDLPIANTNLLCDGTSAVLYSAAYDGGMDRFIVGLHQGGTSNMGPDRLIQFELNGSTNPCDWTKTDLSGLLPSGRGPIQVMSAGGSRFYVATGTDLRRYDGTTLTALTAWNSASLGGTADPILDHRSYHHGIISPQGFVFFETVVATPGNFSPFLIRFKADTTIDSIFSGGEEDFTLLYWLSGIW